MMAGTRAKKDPRWDLDQDQTWAASVQRYDREKLVKPGCPEVLPGRLYRDARTNKKLSEREYDITTHKYRASQQEQMISRRETDSKVTHMERAAARAIRYESHYDVVNHSRKVGVPEPPPPPLKVERPPSPVTAAGQAKIHRDRKPKPLYHWPSQTKDRDFHMISNRYLQSDHDQRAEREHQEAKEEAASRFFKTNRYNAVTGTFYDPDEEGRFQKQREIARNEHGKDKYSRAPPHFHQAEGFVYNILAPQIAKNPYELIRQDALQAELDSAPRLKSLFEDNLDDRMQQQKMAQISRAMNRTSEKRYTDVIDKGYNILTNQPFKGRLGRPYAPARQRQAISQPEPYFGLQNGAQKEVALQMEQQHQQQKQQQQQEQQQEQNRHKKKNHPVPHDPVKERNLQLSHNSRPGSRGMGRPRSRPGSGSGQGQGPGGPAGPDQQQHQQTVRFADRYDARSPDPNQGQGQGQEQGQLYQEQFIDQGQLQGQGSQSGEYGGEYNGQYHNGQYDGPGGPGGHSSGFQGQGCQGYEQPPSQPMQAC